MAKKKKKAKQESATGPDPLGEGLERFKAGDYPAARALLTKRAADDDLTDADRRRAEDLAQATKLEPGTLYTALACLAFFFVAIGIGILKQP